MSLNMLYISLVPEYTKYISRNLSKSTFFYLHFDFRLEICVQRLHVKKFYSHFFV